MNSKYSLMAKDAMNVDVEILGFTNDFEHEVVVICLDAKEGRLYKMDPDALSDVRWVPNY